MTFEPRAGFEEKFGVRYPIMLAPMAGFTDGRMAAAVTAAGGLGTFGASNPGQPDEWVGEQIDLIREVTADPFGVGFITPSLAQRRRRFEITLEKSAPVVVLSFSDPQPWLGRARDAGCSVICQVQTVTQAVQAVDEGADALIAEGTEAGGHTGLVGTFPLLRAVLARCPNVPVLAAGGVADARSLAAIMAAGAAGASMGTVFLASEEAPDFPGSMKRLILASDGCDTTWTRSYDIALGLDFPEGIGARVHANAFTRRWDGREDQLRAQLSEVRDELDAFGLRGDEETFVMYGQSAAFVNEVQSIGAIMQQLATGLPTWKS